MTARTTQRPNGEPLLPAIVVANVRESNCQNHLDGDHDREASAHSFNGPATRVDGVHARDRYQPKEEKESKRYAAYADQVVLRHDIKSLTRR
jgi:hypothetical protein